MPFDQTVLNHLASELRGNGVALLAGAGVSFAPPACAPLFRPLRDNLLRTLAGSLDGTLEASVLERSRDLFKADGFLRRGVEPVPEVLFEALHESLEAELFTALRILLELPSPNANHRFVAELARHGLRLLITTNFEDGFEQALSQSGASFDVCADGESISGSLNTFTADQASGIPVWKIHGTLTAGQEETIKVTLTQIARERLDPLKFEPLAAITSRMALLVVGYSGYDADISKVLSRAGQEGKQIYWLSYGPPAPGEPALQILQSWQERGHLLVGDLTDLFSSLGKLIPGIQIHDSETGGCDQTLASRFEKLNQWTTQIPLDKRLEAFSALCWKLSDFESALGAIDALVERSLRAGNGSGLLYCLVMKSNILRSAGRGAEIGQTLSQMQWLRERMGEIGDPKFSDFDAVLLHELGSYFQHLGKPVIAEDAYRKAMAASIVSKEPSLISMVSQSLGAFLSHAKKFSEAKQLFEFALATSVNNGDRYGELKARHELGIISLEAGESQAAAELLQESARVAHEIGDLEIELSSTNELGIIALRVERDYETAYQLFTRTRELARLIGKKPTELTALLYLGDVEQTRKNFEASIEILTECVEAAAAAGDGAIEATALTRRARSYALLGKLDEAETDLGRARSLAADWHPALITEIEGLSALLARAR